MPQAFDLSTKAEQLQATVQLLQSHLENVPTEKELQIIFKSSDTPDNQVKSILNRFVQSFLQKYTPILQTAYRNTTSLNNLHYTILLKEDTMEHRNTIFSFFEQYDLVELATQYPVYFQFVPVGLAEKIVYTEAVKFT